MTYKKDKFQKHFENLNKTFNPFLTLESIDEIFLRNHGDNLEDDLNFFLQYPLQTDDCQIIFDSGLLFKLNHYIFSLSKKIQHKILKLFMHWIEFDEVFSIFIIESGFLINITKHLQDHRDITIELLISLSKNTICARRVALSLKFSDFISNPISLATCSNYIELLLLLLNSSYKNFEKTFRDSLYLLFSTNQIEISYILMSIIEKCENSPICNNIFNILLDDDLKSIILNPSFPDVKKNELAINIIDFIKNDKKDIKMEYLFVQIREIFDILTYQEKSFIIHFLYSFDFYQNDTFIDFFVDHDDIIELPNIDKLLLQILQQIVKYHLNDLEEFTQNAEWELLYMSLLRKNHNICPSLSSCLLELLISPFFEKNKITFGDIISYITLSFEGKDLEIAELHYKLKKYYIVDDEKSKIANCFLNELSKIYEDFEKNIQNIY